MSSYLVLYRSPTSPEEQMAHGSPEQAQAGMDAWTTWAGRAGEAIVDLGSPVSAAGTLGTEAGDLTAGGFLGGFSILQAESAQALRDVLEGHPHLMVEGNTIELYAYLALPGTE